MRRRAAKTSGELEERWCPQADGVVTDAQRPAAATGADGPAPTGFEEAEQPGQHRDEEKAAELHQLYGGAQLVGGPHG